MTYWVRSLVPMEAKSACSNILSAMRAAEGTSIIMPAVFRPWARACSVKALASSAVEIMGAMTHTLALVAASALARAWSWCSRTSGSRRAVR